MEIKRYALFLFGTYYPSGGMDDLVSFHDTIDAAIADAKRLSPDWREDDFQVVDTGTFQVVAHGFSGKPDSEPWTPSLRE